MNKNQANKARQSRHKIGSLLSTISILVIVICGLIFRQYAVDLYRVNRFDPSTEVGAAMVDLELTQKGRFLVEASRSELLEADRFESVCDQVHASEFSAILGCYTNQKIYVLDIDDQRLNGAVKVTLAHEMLHAAYERFSPTKRDHVNQLVKAERNSLIEGDLVLETVEPYEKSDSPAIEDEYFAIFGTEKQELSPELEEIYDDYFSDRDHVVELANQYTQVFDEIEKQQKNLIDELSLLNNQIDQDREIYESMSQELDNDISDFNTRAQEVNGFKSQKDFDQQRVDLENRQKELDSLYEKLSSEIDQFNSRRTELIALNKEIITLQKAINVKQDTLRPVVDQ